MSDMDSESRRNRFTGALDCLRDLVAGQLVDVGVPPADLASLLDLLASEAHHLYDEPDCLHGRPSND